MNKLHFNQTLRHIVGVGLSLSLLGAIPQPAVAASAASSGIEFRIAESGGTYTVYMQPNITPDAPNATVSAQVSIKVPHVAGAAHFAPSNPTALVAGTAWQITSRSDAPPEAPGYDYISFSLDFPEGDFRAFNWAAGTEQAVFTFINMLPAQSAASPSASIAAHLVDNCDVFSSPNSQDAYIGNEITVLGLGEGNAYAGNAGAPIDCPSPAEATSAVAIAVSSSLTSASHSAGITAIQAGDLVTYTYIVSNTGLRSADDLSLTIDLVGLANLHTAANSFAAANPMLYANQAATWHLGQLAPGAQGVVTLTLRAPANNDVLTTTATISATNDNTTGDNSVQEVVQVIAQARHAVNYIYLPLLNR